MKGPYERLKYDLRRHWECPACQRREHTPGWVTSRVCPCQDGAKPAERVCMRLLPRATPRKPAPSTADSEAESTSGSKETADGR